MIKYLLHYAPAKIIPGIVNFLGLMIYARIFTKEEFGRYAYVFAILGLIQSILFPWIRMSCSRFYQKYYKKNKEYEFENFTLFIFLLVSIGLSFLWVLFLCIYNIESQLRDLYSLGLIVIISQALYEQLMALARAKLLSKVFAYSMVTRAILKITFITALVLIFNLNEEAIFIGIIIAQTIPIAIYFKKYFKFNIQYLSLNRSFLKETFQYGFPLTFSFLLVFIVSSSDRILIDYFLDAESVGLYTLPYEFSTFTLTNVFMVFSMAFFPIFVRELEHNRIKKMNQRIRQYAEVLLSITLPFTIAMYMLAPFIAGLFLGSNYNSPEAIRIIQLISIASFLAGLKAYFFDYAFQLGKSTSSQIIPVAFGALSNIIINIILIPILGVIGAVVATIVSYLIGIVLSILIGFKIFPMSIPGKQIIKIIFSNFMLFILLSFLPINNVSWLNLIIIVLTGGITYFMFMFILNIIGVRDLILYRLKLKS
ncbi:oligosaccharide flippase family protein [Virgibacillus salexigens]|uniref:oligosaccharide flippase family protein n=1 Tax=Virgibacillus salexigens TaxID=61016 RepID=UPI00190A9675|nr:oligosaccharide flippase family protein [Virgibacillus salexigens]